MRYEEKTLKKNYIYHGKILNLRCDDAALPNGASCKREIIEHSGGACALCVLDGKALFVRQYRYAYGEEIYEIPAGKLERGEDPSLAAKRELEEETGVCAQALEHLVTLYPTPGYTNEKIYVYLVHGASQGTPHTDEGEFLDVVWLPLSAVWEMLEKGAFQDAKTVVALQYYFLKNQSFRGEV